MVLDSKFAALRKEFNIRQVSDWSNVTPAELLSVDGVGPQTVNHLRLHLANEGLTLAGDQTVDYWQRHLTMVKGTTQIADNQTSVACPFTILVDSAEQLPFTFAGLRADARDGGRPLIVTTKRAHLGPTRGDYTIEGLEGFVHIERKSLQDVIGTVLAFGERREQFERTLAFLAEIPSSAVMVECDCDDAVDEIGDHKSLVNRNAKTPVRTRAKMFDRQVSAWMDDYRVPWRFSRDRRRCELRTFAWLSRFYRKHQAELKRSRKPSEVSISDL